MRLAALSRRLEPATARIPGGGGGGRGAVRAVLRARGRNSPGYAGAGFFRAHPFAPDTRVGVRDALFLAAGVSLVVALRLSLGAPWIP